ncbi:hypothetical protein GCK72_001825 [Caenorhabditis remanei]|nr:hypothetical protein GCK72_001825 [Caenorhabditis remanei]KAF1770008.1 hypothetical protein GCK72_001825 [Caenorhabditis remanei]
MAGDLVIPPDARNNEFRLDMDDTLFQSVVQQFILLDKEFIRAKAEKNASLRLFITSPRFLIEYARLTHFSSVLPQKEYLDRMSENNLFPYRKNVYSFNLTEIVFDKTRHGFREVDFPFDANHGVTAVQDVGGCHSSYDLRNIFVLENMNVPVCRFDPVMFCQSWVLTLFRPKFVFRGLVACPKGDYGLARMIVEVGNSKGSTFRSEASIAFKKGDDEKLGKFIPFEVATPEYNFRPTHIFFFVCIFYVNRNPIPIRGMRVSNCTVQCVLPEGPPSLDAVECNDSFPAGAYDTPPVMCNYVVEHHDDPEYLRDLKAGFFSTFDNYKNMKAAEVARAEQEMYDILEGNILEDRMDVQEVDGLSDNRKRVNVDNEDEPLAKKKC